MLGKPAEKHSPAKRLTVIDRGLRAGWLLAGLSALTAAQADIGPAFSGLSGRVSLNAPSGFDDANLDQDKGLAGRINVSFDTHYSVVLDSQVIKRFSPTP